MPKTVKVTKKHKIDPATGLIRSAINIDDVKFFYRPSYGLSLTDCLHIRLRLSDGTLRHYPACSVRWWIIALADRDDHYDGRIPKYCATELTAQQEEHIRSLIADTPRVRFINDIASGKKYIRYHYTVQKQTIFCANFPATEEGVMDAKIYARFVTNNNKKFCMYHEIQSLNKSIIKWKQNALTGMKYIYPDKDYDSNEPRWIVLMPLHLLTASDIKKTTYDGTEEGLALAKAHRAWVVRYGELPPWKGSNLSTIKWHTNITRTHEKYIEVAKDKFVLGFFDGERWFHRKYSTLKEATYARNQVHILGDISPFALTFTPTPESDFDHPMHTVKTVTERQKTRKDYVSREKQQLIHDELIEWIRERNRLNEGLSTHIKYYQKIVRPPLTPNLIEAIVMISDRLKNYPKYRKYFGEAFDRMQRRAIERIDRSLHYYKPTKATPFSFLTMLICNCFDAVKLELRNEYRSGNGIPNYASYNDDYMGLHSLEKAHAGTDIEMIHGEDEEIIDSTNIADIIRKDIAKYMDIADSMGLSFAKYLTMCKQQNKIIDFETDNKYFAS